MGDINWEVDDGREPFQDGLSLRDLDPFDEDDKEHMANLLEEAAQHLREDALVERAAAGRFKDHEAVEGGFIMANETEIKLALHYHNPIERSKEDGFRASANEEEIEE